MQGNRRSSTNRILIVDDDAILAALYRIKLKNAGFEVELAESGEAGLRKVQDFQPDLVVLDLMLGDMNGVEILKQLRGHEETHRLPIVVFSSAYIGGHIEAAESAGATKCLYKGNTTPNRLVDEIQYILNPTSLSRIADLVTGEAPPSAGQSTSQHKSTVAMPLPFSPTPPPKPKPPAILPQDEMQGSIRNDLLKQIDDRLKQAPRALADWRRDPKNLSAPYYGALYNAIRSISSSARLVGRHKLANLAGALEVLLKDTKRNPDAITASLGDTVAAAVDTLPGLARFDESDVVDFEIPPLIVVLDDNEAAREVAAAALERAQLRAVCLGTAETALLVGQWNRIDLAIVDIEMPGMRGTDFVRELRKLPENRDCPVVFLSGRPDVADIASSPEMMPSGFLVKPTPAMEIALKSLTTLYRYRLVL